MAGDLNDLLGVRPADRPDDAAAATGGFPALHVIATIHKVFAVVVALAGVVAFFFLAVATKPGSGPLLVAVVVGTPLATLLLWGSGELILLFLRIEQNTRQRR